MARLQVLGDDHLVVDQADHPVIGAGAHAVAVAVCCLRIARELAVVEIARRREGVAGGVVRVAAACVVAEPALRLGVRVQPLPAVLDARNLRARTETNTQRSSKSQQGCRVSGELTGSRAHMDPLGQVPSVTKTGFGTGNRSVPFFGIGGTLEAPSALTGTSLVSVRSQRLFRRNV